MIGCKCRYVSVIRGEVLTTRRRPKSNFFTDWTSLFEVVFALYRVRMDGVWYRALTRVWLVGKLK